MTIMFLLGRPRTVGDGDDEQMLIAHRAYAAGKEKGAGCCSSDVMQHFEYYALYLTYESSPSLLRNTAAMGSARQST